MPRFSANLSMLFTEVPMIERYAAAAAAGFRAVEVQFPYEHPAEVVRAQLEAHDLTMVLHNLPAGDWAGGERGIACLPDRVDEFRDGVARAIGYARTLGVPQLNCLAGIAPLGADERVLRATLVGNLRFAASELAKAGLGLLIEPINTFDIPGFHVSRTAQALDILDEVGAANAKVQFDCYHAQRMEGELCGTLSRHLARIGHVQIADNPGRHEPGTGEIAHDFLFRHLDAIGYRGWVGCEYKPATTTVAGLGWLDRLTR
ncbi:hydroxypyruvate isomerase [Leptothrix discophora]|uniref:Hydroxypyruvate isomerase n=1 Tax=Leptothrix discophora TaxID=89 RepID=A0ABT9G070_LEPDI|nr:hydroxypyruvate isomerase [Leptothrix discophora]MDP4299875.1 hydroxypyruvate isomerase [Leptothrix discophora]